MVATAAVIPPGAAKKPRAKSSHPRTAEMVDAAIVALKEKGGSSLQAIKKYMSKTYAIDAEKLSPFINKYLKSGVLSKKLVQTKGKGASGSFRIAGAEAAVVKRIVANKAPLDKSTKSPAKPNSKPSPKKKPLKSLAAKPPKPKAAKKPKAPKKANKPKKAPARK